MREEKSPVKYRIVSALLPQSNMKGGAVDLQVFAMSISSLNQLPQTSRAPQGVAGLTLGTKVMTMDGELPVEFLSAGDRIITRVGVRRLAAVSVQLLHDVDMVRIGAGTLGFDRPCTETLVPLHQMILIRDWRAQALYGAPQALVAAGRLADGTMIRVETLSEARVFTLSFETDVVIYAGGLELECQREAVSA